MTTNGSDHSANELHSRAVAPDFPTNGNGQSSAELHRWHAVPSDTPGDHYSSDSQRRVVSPASRTRRRGQGSLDLQAVDAAPSRRKLVELLAKEGAHQAHQITAFHVGRWLALEKARIAVGNQLKALERNGVTLDAIVQDAAAHFSVLLQDAEEEEAKRAQAAARQHPLWKAWGEQALGFGLSCFALVLGNIHALDRYPSPSHFWSYCGLAVKGGRSIRRAGHEKLGFSPLLRAILLKRVGDGLVKMHTRADGGGPYATRYRERRAAVLARPRLGPSGCPFSDAPHASNVKREDDKTGWKRKTGEKAIVQCVKVDDAGEEHSAHVYRDAVRCAVKLLLKDMWEAGQKV